MYKKVKEDESTKNLDNILQHLVEDPESYLVITNRGGIGVKGTILEVLQIFTQMTYVLNKDCKIPKEVLNQAFNLAFDKEFEDIMNENE